MKECTKCRIAKPFEQFYKRKNTLDGRISHCKTCDAEYKKAYYSLNKDTVLKQQEYYRKNNPDKRSAQHRAYRENNRDKLNAKWSAREAKKMNGALLSSVDDNWLVQEIYHLAKLRSRATGISWHVDHIVPLQGKNVSGLHVPRNLRVIPAKLNWVKNNSFDVLFDNNPPVGVAAIGL